MKRFITNRHGRIVFPFNFLPELDFSVFETLTQFEAVMKRDFDAKAPSEANILERLSGYQSRYELLQDLTRHLRNLNRYAMTMFEKRPTRWVDVPRRRDDIFLPQLHATNDVANVTNLLEIGYRSIMQGLDNVAEDQIFALLLDVYRATQQTTQAVPLHRTLAEQITDPTTLAYRLACYDPDYPVYSYRDIVDYTHPIPEIESLMRHAMVLRNEFRWHPRDVDLTPIAKLSPDDVVVVFHPKTDAIRDFVRRVRQQPPPPRLAAVPAKPRPPVKPYAPVVVQKELKVMPRIEALAVRKGERICTNDDLIRNAAYSWSPMSADDIRRKTGIEQRVYTEQTLEDISLEAAHDALAKSGRRAEEIGAVLFCSCTSARTMPAVSAWISAQLGMLQTHMSCDIIAACAGLSYGIAEAVRLLQENGRPVLLVGGEKFSDKVGTVRTSRMLFGDAASALVIGPASNGAPPDIEVFQTYASGPMCEVDSIVWPNPDFDNGVTVYGPEVKALVKRYLGQMIEELRMLPHPDGGPGSLLDAIELVVPHQANKTMVINIAREAGIAPQRLYFNIDRVGNTSAASIPVALHDAVRERVISRPTRIFAPGFGAGAVGGYVIMRMDPAVAA